MASAPVENAFLTFGISTFCAFLIIYNSLASVFSGTLSVGVPIVFLGFMICTVAAMLSFVALRKLGTAAQRVFKTHRSLMIVGTFGSAYATA